MFSINSRKCQEPPRTDKSQTPTNADLQSTYYSTLSTKLDTPRRTLPTIRGRRCSRRMAHSDELIIQAENTRNTCSPSCSVSLFFFPSATRSRSGAKETTDMNSPQQSDARLEHAAASVALLCFASSNTLRVLLMIC